MDSKSISCEITCELPVAVRTCVPTDYLPSRSSLSHPEAEMSAPHAAWRDLDWLQQPATRHSIKGQIGVDYLLFSRQTVVVKRGPNVGREWLATQLAMQVGCHVPTPMTLGPPPDPAMLDLLKLSPETPILMMGFVSGRTFFELSQDDQEAFCQPDAPRGRRLIDRMGLALAFDLFSGNVDRFPAVGPLGANSGNLMICDDDIICIDNAIWHYAGEESGRERQHNRWRAKLATALNIVMPEDSAELAEARRFLKRASSMVTARLRDVVLPESAFQDSWARAFCDGVLAVSALSHEGLDTQVARLQPAPVNLAADVALLHENLAQFQQAAVQLRRRPTAA